MNFEAIIGLEIHVEMKTKSKIFSSAPVTFGSVPNTCVAPLDMAYPGTMPVVNKQAVINAIRVCNALHMEIDDELHFERKNYFYTDLAKGYQITQQNRPIGKNGYIEIDGNNIGIERLHLEEDTCKQLHEGDFTLLDYNRSGIPLLEIVTEPTIRSGLEAKKLVEQIRSIVSFLGVSDGKMEEGSLRVDINVSLRPIGSTLLGKRTEIKNVNTLNNIKRAIDFEIKRQESSLFSGVSIKQETRRYDEEKRETVPMRMKVNSIDYKYFTDPNLIPIKLSKEFIEEAIRTSPDLAETKVAKYKELGLSSKYINLLISNQDISSYFDELISYGVKPLTGANWLLVDIQSILNREDISIDELGVSPSYLADLLKFIDIGAISNKQARDIFREMLKNHVNPNIWIEQNGIVLLDKQDKLLDIIRELLNNNPQAIRDYKNGKQRVVSYLVGQVMKITKGQADPNLTTELVIKVLKEK